MPNLVDVYGKVCISVGNQGNASCMSSLYEYESDVR